MPFRMEHRDGIVWLTLTGAITANDLREVSVAAAEIEAAMPRTPPRLTDLSLVDSIDLAFTDVLALANVRRSKSFPNSFKSAIVIGNDVQKGYARMFQTLNDHPMIQIELFTNREEAERWLRVPIAR